MGLIKQFVELVTVRVYGPEPVGAAQAGAIQDDAIRAVTGRSMPSLNRRGITGDPTRTFNGDMGPLQGDFTNVRTVAAPNSYRPGFSTALPSTAGGGTVQDHLGNLGI